MERFKYIYFENVGLVIFEAGNNHQRMASLIRDTPISAGFIFLPGKNACNNEAHCFGRSESLNLDSREEDTRLLRIKLNNKY